MKKRMAMLLALAMAFGGAVTVHAEGEEKILKLAESFAYASVDVHKNDWGWFTQIYGVSEGLFRISDTMEVTPCLAEAAEVSEDGLVWTITLRDGTCFSDGDALTADMVVRNFARLAENNESFSYLQDFTIEPLDDKTLTITTKEAYPTMLNDLARPELGIMDLDCTTDFDADPICTGPFKMKSFEPEGTVEVEKNENYWGGDVALDGAVFYYMQDDDSKLMAMQNGEIDGYNSVTAAAQEIYEADPDTYTVTVVPATRLQFYVLNENRLDDAVRSSINLAVDDEVIAEYLDGTVTAAVGPFSTSAEYGQVTKPEPDTEAAKAALEADGYTLNGDGFYEKDGEVLTLNICYYAARSLDSIAIVMQDQLKAAGIASTLTCEEDPDATYMTTGDYDIALYCMIADLSGDPYYMINSTLREGSFCSAGGYQDEEVFAAIDELKTETDTQKRAELANQMIQKVIDDNAFGYVGLFNKITVARKGVTGIAENNPFDFYGIDASTNIEE